MMNGTQTITERGLQLFEPDPNAVYSLETASNLAQVRRHTILVFCKHGMISPVVDPEVDGYYFNDEAIRVLRRIGQMQRDYNINLTAARIIVELMNEVERLRGEVGFLRG